MPETAEAARIQLLADHGVVWELLRRKPAARARSPGSRKAHRRDAEIAEEAQRRQIRFASVWTAQNAGDRRGSQDPVTRPSRRRMGTSAPRASDPGSEPWKPKGPPQRRRDRRGSAEKTNQIS